MLKEFDEEFAKIETEYYSHPRDELLELVSDTSKAVAIFGAGAVGISVAESLKCKLGGRFVAFCDNHKTGFNDKFHVPIVSPEYLARNYTDAIIIVAASYKYNDELYNQAINLGFSPENVFRRYSGYELYSMEVFKRHYDGYKWAYYFFDDYISKKIILDRIRSYLFFCELECSLCEDQYFEKDIINLTNNEVFVDGGCYTGDTIFEFIKRTNNKYSFVYGFEPDKYNFKEAEASLLSHKNIKIINKGLWGRAGQMSFASGGNGSSRINLEGEDIISLISLDEFFKDVPHDMLPTFIKLDIEGAEKRALLGAEAIIRKCHPKLAVCIYHKVEDIYELTQLINGFNQYKFFIRHYSIGDVETVLYAI